MNENQFYEGLLCLSQLKVDWVEASPTKIILHCHHESSHGVCPQCSQVTTQLHEYTNREVRDLNILEKEVWLHLWVKHYVCKNCKRYFSEDFDFVEPNKSYTKRQAKWVFMCCAKQPFSEVGALLNIHSKTVERIYYEQGEKRLNLGAKYSQVRRLGIDEISQRKGKGDYCCVLTDLDRNIQLDILPNRKKETLIAHFKSLGANFCQQIQAVSCDMWEPYILVSQECFPNATITIDRFHVVKALNESIDKHRKSLRKEFSDEAVFKDIKWILFKQQVCPIEAENLQLAFKKNIILEELVSLRNQFHHLFEMAPNANWLNEQLSTWKQEAKNLALPLLDKFLKTLQNWQQYIANFAENGLTNAPTEGLNNMIRFFKRISFGLPNFQHMRLRVLLNYS